MADRSSSPCTGRTSAPVVSAAATSSPASHSLVSPSTRLVLIGVASLSVLLLLIALLAFRVIQRRRYRTTLGSASTAALTCERPPSVASEETPSSFDDDKPLTYRPFRSEMSFVAPTTALDADTCSAHESTSPRDSYWAGSAVRAPTSLFGSTLEVPPPHRLPFP